MPSRLSRRKLASYTAEQLMLGNNDVIKQLAGLIVQEKRQREVDLLLRDIEVALAERGVVIAKVTTAHSLGDSLREEVKRLVAADTVVVTEVLDSRVIGGIIIDTPGKRYDGTIKHRLSELRALKN